MYEKILADGSREKAMERLGGMAENMSLVLPALIIYRKLIEETGAEFIWVPPLTPLPASWRW